MKNNTSNNVGNSFSQQEMEGVVLNVFREKFPNVGDEVLIGLVQDIGKTIMLETLQVVVEEISSKNETLGSAAKEVLAENKESVDKIIEMLAEICTRPEINIDVLQISRQVALKVLGSVFKG